MTTSKDDKTQDKYEMLVQRGKSNTTTTNNTTRRDKSEGTGERIKTKKIRRKDQTIQTKQDFPRKKKTKENSIIN